MTKKDWFDDHVMVIGGDHLPKDFGEKVKARLRLEVARKYGHKEGCDCPFCRGAMIKLERDADD